MAWGIFKKIKDGLIKFGKKVKDVGKKVWDTTKKVGNFLNKNIIQPLAPTISKMLIQSGDPKMAAVGSGILAGSATLDNVLKAVNNNDVGAMLTEAKKIPGLENMNVSQVKDIMTKVANTASSVASKAGI